MVAESATLNGLMPHQSTTPVYAQLLMTLRLETVAAGRAPGAAPKPLLLGWDDLGLHAQPNKFNDHDFPLIRVRPVCTGRLL